jgi:hypothetical protein
LRQPDGAHDTVLDSEVGRIQLGNGRALGQQRAPAEARFVERRSKDMRVVDRQNAPPIREQPAEPGDTRALPTRFDRTDPLVSVERVEAIVAPDVLPKVDRPAVRIDDGRCGTDELRRAVSIDDVRARDQLNQSSNDGIGRGGALVIAQHEAAHVETLTLSQSVVCGEEECFSTNERPAQGSAELVALERVRFRRQLEEVAGIQCVVPQEFECLSPELVGTRLSDDIDDRAGHVAVLRAERGVVDLEFLNARNRRLEHQRAEREVVGRDPVDQESDGLLTIAGRVEGERSSPAERRRGESGLRGRQRPRRQQSEIDEVPAVQWNLLHRLRRDDMTDRGRRTIDERDLRLAVTVSLLSPSDAADFSKMTGPFRGARRINSRRRMVNCVRDNNKPLN